MCFSVFIMCICVYGIQDKRIEISGWAMQIFIGTLGVRKDSVIRHDNTARLISGILFASLLYFHARSLSENQEEAPGTLIVKDSKKEGIDN